MKAAGNFIWFIMGGVIMGLLWWVAGLLAYITIIGIPWGKACFVIGKFTFFPFGREAISRKELTLEGDIGTGVAGVIGNVLWFILAGWWLAISHLISGVTLFATIVGIPFGIQHFKLAGVSLCPVGRTIVSKEVAEIARRKNAETMVDSLRTASNKCENAVQNHAIPESPISSSAA